MNLIRVSFLVLAFLLSYQSEASCWNLSKNVLTGKVKTPYKDMSEAELFRIAEKIEDQTARIRTLRKNTEPAINKRVDDRLEDLDAFMKNGSLAIAQRNIRGLFLDVELSYYAFKRNNKVLEAISSLNTNASPKKIKGIIRSLNLDEHSQKTLFERVDQYGSYLDFKNSLEVESRELLVLIGNKAHFYKRIRLHLEDLPNKSYCDERCQELSRELLRSVGVTSGTLKERFPSIFNSLERFPIEEFNIFINKNPLAWIVMAKQERNAEFFAALKEFTLHPSFLDRIFTSFYNFPVVRNSRVVNFFRMVYNYQARTLHMRKISKVVRSSKQVESKFYLMREFNSMYPHDELMVTYARRADRGAATSWREFKTFAKEKEPDFFKRMLGAEKKARIRGDISPVYQQSLASLLAGFAFVGGGGLAYYYYIGIRDPADVIVDDLEGGKDCPETPIGSGGDNSGDTKPVDLSSDAKNLIGPLPPQSEATKPCKKRAPKVEVPVGGKEDKLIDEASEVLIRIRTTKETVVTRERSLSSVKWPFLKKLWLRFISFF